MSMVYQDSRDVVVVLLGLFISAIVITGIIYEVIDHFVILGAFIAVPVIGFAYTLKSYLKTKFPSNK